MNDLFVVPLTKGHFAIVDIEDAPLVAGKKWRVTGMRTGHMYARAKFRDNGPPKNWSIHRWILRPSDDLVVDHINHNGLDNRRENLRVCTKSENAFNLHGAHRDSATGILGVERNQRGGKPWSSRVTKDGLTAHSLSHDCKIEAAIWRDLAAMQIQGEFARLNFECLKEVFSNEAVFAEKYPEGSVSWMWTCTGLPVS